MAAELRDGGSVRTFALEAASRLAGVGGWLAELLRRVLLGVGGAELEGSREADGERHEVGARDRKSVV